MCLTNGSWSRKQQNDHGLRQLLPNSRFTCAIMWAFLGSYTIGIIAVRSNSICCKFATNRFIHVCKLVVFIGFCCLSARRLDVEVFARSGQQCMILEHVPTSLVIKLYVQSRLFHTALGQDLNEGSESQGQKLRSPKHKHSAKTIHGAIEHHANVSMLCTMFFKVLDSHSAFVNRELQRAVLENGDELSRAFQGPVSIMQLHVFLHVRPDQLQHATVHLTTQYTLNMLSQSRPRGCQRIKHHCMFEHAFFAKATM